MKNMANYDMLGMWNTDEISSICDSNLDKLFNENAFKFFHWTKRKIRILKNDDCFIFPDLLMYCNETYHKLSYYKNYKVLQSLDKNKSYLNVGMGGGFLEIQSKEYNIESAELYDNTDLENEDDFRFLRMIYKTKADYNFGDFLNDDWIIDNCNRRYDALIFHYFRPFNLSLIEDLEIATGRSIDYIRDFEKFKIKLKAIKKYTDVIICADETLFDRYGLKEYAFKRYNINCHDDDKNIRFYYVDDLLNHKI